MVFLANMFPVKMVDMVASNLKLRHRSRNMLRSLSGKCRSASDYELDSLLARCNRSVKLAILVAESQEAVDICEGHLHSAGGFLTKALAAVHRPSEKTVDGSTTSRRFVLCIDGGGTKCAAVVTDGSGDVYRGSAGPCNLYDAWISTLEILEMLTGVQNRPCWEH